MGDRSQTATLSGVCPLRWADCSQTATLSGMCPLRAEHAQMALLPGACPQRAERSQPNQAKLCVLGIHSP